MTVSTPTLTENLRLLNRKERFFLIGEALGNRDFRLDDVFRERLGDTLGLTIPPNAFVAMDYHLNWLYAALVLTYERANQDIYLNRCNQQGQNLATGEQGLPVEENQEDVDLLVAWNDPSPHIVIVEAKGATYFTNKQLESKLKRLVRIFGRDGRVWDSVTPHLCLVSPRESRGLRTNKAPGWALVQNKFAWMQLSNWCGQSLAAVTRCDDGGRVSRHGGHWKLTHPGPHC